MANLIDKMTDSLLFRKLYTKILARQVHAEHRVQRLMIVDRGVNATFHERLRQVKEKVEEDRKKIQRLGECLAVLEKKEELTSKVPASTTQHSSGMTTQNYATGELSSVEKPEPRPNSFATTLFNVQEPQKKYNFSEAEARFEKFDKNYDWSIIPLNAKIPRPKEGFANTLWGTSDLATGDVDIFFENQPFPHLAKFDLMKYDSADVLSKTDSPWLPRIFSGRTFNDSETQTGFSAGARPSQGSPCPKKVCFVECPSIIDAPETSDVRVFGSPRSDTSTRWISNFGEARLVTDETGPHKRNLADNSITEEPFAKVLKSQYREPFQHHQVTSCESHDNRERISHKSHPQGARESFDHRRTPHGNHKAKFLPVQVKDHELHPHTGHKFRGRRGKYAVSSDRVVTNDKLRRSDRKSLSPADSLFWGEDDQVILFGHNHNKRARQARRPTGYFPRVTSPGIGSEKKHDRPRQIHSDRNNAADDDWMELFPPSSPLSTEKRLNVTRTDSTNPESNKAVLSDLVSSLPQETTPTLKTANGITAEDDDEQTLNIASLFQEKAESNPRVNEWLDSREQSANVKKENTEGNSAKQYQAIDETRRHSTFVSENALLAMRRQSWAIHLGDERKKWKIPVISSIIRRFSTKGDEVSPKTLIIIKGDKKEFHVKKDVRRRMSVRPLPDTPSESDDD